MQPTPPNYPYAPYGSPYGPPGGQAPKKRSKAWLLLLLVIPMVFSAACLVLYAIDSRGHVDIGAMKPACNGGGVPEAALYTPGSTSHKVTWLQRDGSDWRKTFGDPLEAAIRGIWTDETALVVCAEAPVQQVLERCPYSNGRVIERTQWQQSVRVVVGRTGQTLIQKTLIGDQPANCAETEMFSRRSGAEVHREGHEIPDATVLEFLRPYASR